MANLPETPVWETGIYQLEETDPVQGGPNGIDNQQGKQLANRTAWLKSQVETLGTGKQPLDTTLTAIAALNGVADRIAYFTGPDTVALTTISAFIRTLLDDGDASAARSTLGAISQTQLDAAISALVNSSPATLNTLNELADALGNDANFATTVTNALATKAPIASPVLTGDPKAPTPAQFDNDTSLATTEFVQRALGNFRSDSAQISVDTTLTAAAAGSAYIVTGAASNITLPTLASASPGTAFTFVTNKVVSFKGNGAEQIHNGAGQSNSYSVFPGEALTIVAAGSVWNVVSHGYGAGSYAANLAANGYQKLPSGLIIQWGSVIIGTTGVAINFPVAFPNVLLHVSGAPISSAVGGAGNPAFSSGSLTGTTAYPWGTGSYTCRWLAVGY